MAIAEVIITGGTPFGDMTTPGNAFNGVTSEAGAACANKSIGTGTTPSDCYCGTTLSTAKRFGQAIIHGSNAQGFVTVANPSVTLWVYGKLGSNPANSTDGTLLSGPLTFTDTADESAGRTLSITDTGTYDRVWARVTHNSATARLTFVSELRVWEVTVVGDLVTSESGSDTAAFTGSVAVIGNLVASESGSDTAAFTGTVASTGVTGDMAAVETGADTAAFTGVVTVSGSLAATEVGADVATLTGSVLVSGALAATEAVTPDTAVFSGTVAVSGNLIATEIGTDTASFTGILGRKGDLAAVETGSDTASFTGILGRKGDLAAQETGVDTASFTLKLIVTGDLVTAETGSDTASFTGIVTIKCNLVAVEIGADTADFSGAVAISGVLDATEIGNDTAAFDAIVGSTVLNLDATEVGNDISHIFITAVVIPDKPDYVFLREAVGSGSWISIAGGDYIWTTTADDFNGAFALLQAMGPDGVTAMDVQHTKVNAMFPISVSDGTLMRVLITGRTFAANSDLRAFGSRTYAPKAWPKVPAGCETAKAIATGMLMTIKASNTDPRLQDTGDTAKGFGFHVIGIPKNSNGKLWIQLNGTGAKPYLPKPDRYLTEVWDGEIMGRGYTVIELAYDNDVSIATSCGENPIGKLTDNCAGNLRLEVLTGQDLSPFRNVNVFNSVNYRIEALLNYMQKIGLPLPPNSIPFAWPNVRVSGHSQGSGHAYYIAKYWGVKYACFLSGPFDPPDNVPTVRPPEESIADWYMDPSANVTPKSQMGAFLTVDDPAYPFFTFTYNLLGLTKNVEWFEHDKRAYIDDKGTLINAHQAGILDPSLAVYRAQASFDRDLLP